MLRAGKELIMDPMMKASENKQIMGDLYKNKKSMDFIRDSVMTPENEAFYQKYKKLAGFASDNQERERLMDIANSARQNAQISSRINYGLGQLGYDTIGKEPFESYTTAMFGEANPRFNMKNFTAGIESTGIGKAFIDEANKARAKEAGDSLVGNAMKSFDTFAGDLNSMPGFMLKKDGMIVPPKENDMNYFDPFLNPDIPFYKKRRPYYLNDYGL